jgi:hypothetical protein
MEYATKYLEWAAFCALWWRFLGDFIGPGQGQLLYRRFSKRRQKSVVAFFLLLVAFLN